MSVANWIIGGGKDYRNRRGRFLRRLSGIGSRCDNHVDVELDKLVDALGESFRPTFRIAVLKDDVLSFNIAKLTEPFLKSLKARLRSRTRTRHQNPDSRDFSCLLRLSDHRSSKQHHYNKD